MREMTVYVTAFEALRLHPDFPFPDPMDIQKLDMRVKDNKQIRAMLASWEAAIDKLSTIAFVLDIPIHHLLPVEIEDGEG